MYVTPYAADNQQTVLDTIKDTENAKPLLISHIYKCFKAYIDDPRPMSEKMGEEIENELENLK